MRKMYIMRGAPGSGKSTLIEALGATSYATGRDTARQFLNGIHHGFQDDKFIPVQIGPDTQEPLVSRLVQDSVTARMQQGETIFLDITAQKPSDITGWSALAARFSYEIVVVDCQGDLTDEELLERNKHRPAQKQLSEPIIMGIAEKVRSLPVPKGYRVVKGTVEDMRKELTTPVEDYNAYTRLIVVGDIQGCNTALQDLLNKVEYNPTAGDRLIVLGDVFDRGVENAGVFETLKDLDFDYISGNHDRNMQYLLNGAFSQGFKDTRIALKEITDAGHTRAELSDFVDRSVPLKVVKFGDLELWLNHGGVLDLGESTEDGYITGLLPMQQFWYGTGGRDKTYLARGDYKFNVDKEFNEWAMQDDYHTIVQFHGHRSVEDAEFAEYAHSVSLESNVEFDGGKLSAVIVSKTDEGASYTPIQVKNTVTSGPMTWHSAPPAKKKAKKQRVSLQDRLRATPSEVITEKFIAEHGVYAYNFTRTAFRDGLWDPDVVRARGLFINDEGAVVQRGYDKFFNVGERPETELDSVLAALGDGTPVTVKHKLNGYLGIVSTQGSGELRCYSKAGPTQFGAEFADLLKSHLGSEEKVQEFTDWLQRKRVSLTFEVLSPNDPHVVNDGVGVVLLDALANTERMVLLDHVADDAANLFNFRRPETKVIQGSDEVARAIEEAYASDTEGAVFRHNKSGFMVKVKSDSYSQWKKFRGALERAVDPDKNTLSARDVDTRTPEEDALLSLVTQAAGYDLTKFLTRNVSGHMVVNLPALRSVVGK